MMKQKIKKNKKIKIFTIYFVQSHLNLNNFIKYLAFVSPQSTLYQLVFFVYVCEGGMGVGFVCLFGVFGGSCLFLWVGFFFSLLGLISLVFRT